MKMGKLLKLMSLCLFLVLVVLVFVSCAGKGEQTPDPENTTQQSGEDKFLDKSPLTPKDRDNHVEPDTSKLEVREATKKAYSAKTEEEFVEALTNFANPNGNEYDALAVLGDYGYNEKGDDLLARFKTASADWHATIVEKVGDKCVVDIILKSKTAIDKSDVKVADWETVNGLKCEAYANVKCTISTSYAKDPVTLSLDIVKINGNWHFASVSSIDNVLNAITTEIYR